MDKFDRIYALHGLLANSRRPVPITTIMQQLECSKATAKRIIENMRLYLSAPLEYDRARNGYYYNNQNSEHPFQLPGIWFNTSELHSLLTAQALLERVDPGLYSSQLRPLHGKIRDILRKAGHKDTESYRRIRILSLAKRKFDNHVFRQIATAVLERKQLHVIYNGRGDGKASKRIISPQRCVHYRDNWYLDAWCHSRDDFRTFAVERIEQARVLNQAAKHISEKELDSHFASAYGIFSGKATQTAVLRFSPQRARWVAEEEWHPQQQGHWREDGYYELHIPYGNPTELIMDILKHGADVEVIKPASLRRTVRQRIYNMAYLYDDRYEPPK